ncbi:MAG TPA: acetate--CoA ligase family protein [Xanthomonadales bacterium]|nr:acetate--CoA ligase family protein [Xanthomonadales bacterium]
MKPRSVAVVGASDTPGALGASTISNLDRMGFSGDVYLVNPRRDSIGLRPCLKSVDDLPTGTDVAVLAIPKAAVLDTVRALATREVGGVIIFSAGFAEGGEQGLGEQQEIATLARDNQMAVLGPNCLGLVNYVDGIALTFVETPSIPLDGRQGIGIVSQSGAMAAVLSVMLTSRDLAVSWSVSTGNEAASGVEDYIEYLIDDPNTRTIGMIVEQFRQPRRFLQLARKAHSKGKQIVLLHPGRSSAARESAATHTGAMAGDYAVMRTLVERQGVLVADNLEELGDLLEIALRCRNMPTRGAAVLTESGAFKALTLDLCDQIGLALPTLDDENAPLLREAMPSFVPVSNPVDLTAQALVDPGLYQRSLSALLQDERFGSIVLGIIQTDATTSNLKFPPIIAAIQQLDPVKPVIFAGLDEGAEVPRDYIRQLRDLAVPYFPSPDRALRAVARFSALAERNFDTSQEPPTVLPESLPSGVIAEFRAKQLLAPLGIPFPAGRFVDSEEAAIAAALELGFPVVLKAQSAALSHKSDAGGVILNVADEKQLRQAWERLHANLEKHAPGLRLDGVLIEKMGRSGLEMIVGARNDPDWGPVVLVGFGGVQAEVLKDVRLIPADLTTEAIMGEIYQLKSAALLRAFRGQPARDVNALAGLILQLGGLLLAQPSIREIDLNPVIVYPVGEGVIALDALMLTGADSGKKPA